MDVVLGYSDRLSAYRLSPSHPMRAERVTLSVDLMDAWGLLDDEGPPERSRGLGGPESRPRASAGLVRARRVDYPALSDEELELVHARDYVAAVRSASTAPERWHGGYGIGPGDTPAFSGMHEISAAICGATAGALDDVIEGRADAAFCPAGGLHHAQRAAASGFCVYNDCAVAIERASRARPGLRVAYVDVDAHHGDGVEAAFHDRPDVLTLSVHESGRYLFPGTGRAEDSGDGAGVGATIDVPLPPGAGPESYPLVLGEIIAPALRTFAPDVVVAQIGADSHRADPLTHLHQSVRGFVELVSGIITLSDEICDRRIVLTGGGGYEPFSAVPRMWASALAVLIGRPVPEELPHVWLDRAREAALAAGAEPGTERRTFDERIGDLDEAHADEVRAQTQWAIDRVRASAPLLGGGR